MSKIYLEAKQKRLDFKKKKSVETMTLKDKQQFQKKQLEITMRSLMLQFFDIMRLYTTVKV